MSEFRAKITRIDEGVYLIDDAGESSCYLICGEDKALLFDTVNGKEDLSAVVRTLTDLPVIVVNSHGHGDHVLGNQFFDEAWLHPADFDLYGAHGAKACPNCKILPLEEGQIFDLGGTKLEVIPLAGHTAGSIVLLDRGRGLLFTGDAINTHLWMQLDHSLPIEAERDSLLALKAKYEGTFHTIWHGHARAARPASLVDTLLTACEELIEGQIEGDPEYCWARGVCSRHLLHLVGDPNECVVYVKDRL